jgi:hypothetical protein
MFGEKQNFMCVFLWGKFYEPTVLPIDIFRLSFGFDEYGLSKEIL